MIKCSKNQNNKYGNKRVKRSRWPEKKSGHPKKGKEKKSCQQTPRRKKIILRQAGGKKNNGSPPIFQAPPPGYQMVHPLVYTDRLQLTPLISIIQ